MSKNCVVLLSGGIDSTTTLAYAIKNGFKPFALTFKYEQRHVYEINMAKKITQHYGIEHKIFDLNLRNFGGSSLTDDSYEVQNYEDLNAIPNKVTSSYVPARNIIFLSIALSYAETIDSSDIFYGPNKTDYNNYPDCRPDFQKAFEEMSNLGTKTGDEGGKFKIHAPLISSEKHEVIELGAKLGVDFSNTISCYNPTSSGISCGNCLSCIIRKESFKKANIADPTKYANI